MSEFSLPSRKEHSVRKPETFILDGTTGLSQIICGDALKELAKFKDHSIDAIITDPPFALSGGSCYGRSSEVSNQFWFYWWKDICKELNRVMDPHGEGFVWCDWETASLMAQGFCYKQQYGLRASQVIYHYREMPGQGNPFRNSVDMILYIRGSKSKAHRIPNTTQNWISKYWYYGKHEYHPSEKSVDITRQLIRWCSDEGMLILDPFCGSGTTLIACELEHRRSIGIDIEIEYVDIAKSRLLALRKQTSLMKLPKVEEVSG